MRFKKSILGLLLVAVFAAPSFANANPTSETSKTLKELKTIIQDLNIDITSLDQTTVKVRFMLNSDNEIIVLSTDNADVDATIKYSLNYREVKNSELSKNKIYVLPVSFKAV